ncbi:MAG: ATP-binding protein [Clostridia bacterium]|nr:ATP-binding protein [Clostridia bacterium]
MTDFSSISLSAAALSLFKNLKNDVGVNALIKMCALPEKKELASYWADYYLALCEKGCENGSGEYFDRLVCEDENPFSLRVVGCGNADSLGGTAEIELRLLDALSKLEPNDFISVYGEEISAFPKWKAGKKGVFDVEKLKATLKRKGCGVFAKSIAYSYDVKEKTIVPIENVNPIKLSDLKLYEDCKETVAENTLDFLEGMPANNVLLYGDRGTGKSSTVHAVLNEYAGRGLRLLEVSKAAIRDFPTVFKLIGGMKCFRFIIFIDDLTFVEGADDFAELKAALEGSVSRLDNALIYATSNRRHLVKENYEGSASDMHVNDTVQEQMSLSDRFGITVTFLSPDKREFISILKEILDDRNIKLDDTALSLVAERYALRKGGRSGRTAKQLADMIESRLRRGLDVENIF